MKQCCKCNSSFVTSNPNKRFCSPKCSNSRIWDQSHKEKISKSVKRTFELKFGKKICYSKICELNQCRKTFTTNNIRKRFCNRQCASISSGFIGGLNSAQLQNRRSKNEIYFSELCQQKFSDVLTNIRMFNGWDADVILPSQKIAILWNGLWHYKKLKKNHSVKQVQNRDKIKTKEIEKLGYTTYTIKDLGKFDKSFVEKEFYRLLEWMNDKSLVS